MNILKIRDIDAAFKNGNICLNYQIFSYIFVFVFPAILFNYASELFPLIFGSIALILEWLILYIFFYKQKPIKYYTSKFIFLVFPISMRVLLGGSMLYFILYFLDSWLFGSKYEVVIDSDFTFLIINIIGFIYFLYIFPKEINDSNFDD